MLHLGEDKISALLQSNGFIYYQYYIHIFIHQLIIKVSIFIRDYQSRLDLLK